MSTVPSINAVPVITNDLCICSRYFDYYSLFATLETGHCKQKRSIILMNRRKALITIGITSTTGLAGCLSQSNQTDPAHTVSIYLGNRDLTRNVTVRILGIDRTKIFEIEDTLSNDNEAIEDATFPVSTDPDTIIVTVDESQFERDWPGFEQPELPCQEPNNAGIEIWIEQDEDNSPTIRLEANCQSVRVDE